MQAAEQLETAPESRPTLTIIEGGAPFRDELDSHAPQLVPRALQLTRNPERARDLVQDTLLRALRFESSFRPGSNLRAWLAQVMYSVFVSQCRRRQRERRVMDGAAMDPVLWTQPEQAPLMSNLSPGMRRALEQLPDAYIDVLMLVDVHELPYRDAAEELGVPVGTVMSRLHRGRRMLRERLMLQAA